MNIASLALILAPSPDSREKLITFALPSNFSPTESVTTRNNSVSSKAFPARGAKPTESWKVKGAASTAISRLKLRQRTRRVVPWRNVEHVEWATLNYLDWFNNRRIHESLDYVPPVEFEKAYYDTSESESLAVLEMI
jgi:transposase InsO family protein